MTSESIQTHLPRLRSFVAPGWQAFLASTVQLPCKNTHTERWVLALLATAGRPIGWAGNWFGARAGGRAVQLHASLHSGWAGHKGGHAAMLPCCHGAMLPWWQKLRPETTKREILNRHVIVATLPVCTVGKLALYSVIAGPARRGHCATGRRAGGRPVEGAQGAA
jgi:hypothetical protein